MYKSYIRICINKKQLLKLVISQKRRVNRPNAYIRTRVTATWVSLVIEKCTRSYTLRAHNKQWYSFRHNLQHRLLGQRFGIPPAESTRHLFQYHSGGATQQHGSIAVLHSRLVTTMLSVFCFLCFPVCFFVYLLLCFWFNWFCSCLVLFLLLFFGSKKHAK